MALVISGMEKWHAIAFVAAALCLTAPTIASGAGTIGRTTEVARSATAENAGARRDLAVGSAVAARETIATDKVGKAVFQFVDDTQLSVGPGSSIRLDSFVFADETSPSSFVIRATKGAFRFATGRGDHDAYRIQTPTATVGVRGTQFVVSIENAQTRVSVTDGAVVLCPNGGRQNFADCVEAGVGETILSGRNAARVVPTESLPRQRANLLPLRNVASNATETARGLGRGLGDAARGALDDARGASEPLLGAADGTRDALPRTVRDVTEDPGSLPLPSAGSGSAIGGSAGRTAAAVGGAVGGAKASAGVPQGLGGIGTDVTGGGLGGAGAAVGGAAGGGLGAATGGLGGVGGAVGGVGGGLLGR